MGQAQRFKGPERVAPTQVTAAAMAVLAQLVQRYMGVRPEGPEDMLVTAALAWVLLMLATPGQAAEVAAPALITVLL